ncbi:hypothetical protein Ahy_B05g075263 [Arachis hypogaea]|uniref:Replication protein A 70 kDa DNA-binding subunit B/D first OB fold domain-containing protein n=1 Tax=Arachis hypogaea TaxID=3818 RepID=A0A444Z0T6_ARAHY|nr:hypothetical protein Ahy_B05g075263 [Arachis hypogaea]
MQGERDKWLATINTSFGHIEETSRFLQSLSILGLNSAVTLYKYSMDDHHTYCSNGQTSRFLQSLPILGLNSVVTLYNIAWMITILTVAMAARYDLIKCINAGPEHKVWKLKVHVIRLWTVSHFANSGVKAPIEMIVLDKEGDTIQCSIKGIFVPIFEGLPAEDNVYVVTNFAIALNTIKFKPTRHEFRINFKRNTNVRPVQDSSVLLNGFNFVPFKKIHAKSKEDGYLVDVIGQLASKGNLVEFTRDGNPSSYIMIELDDLEGGQKLRVTLWQTLTFNLIKYLEEHPCLTYVVILQMGKMKFYRVMGVSNINYNSKLFINIEFLAARNFFTRMNKLDPVDGQSIILLVYDQPVSIEKDSLRLLVYKTIAEIKEHNQNVVFVTAGTIKEVETEFGWWYKGCKKCRRGLRKLEKRYFCPNCVEDYVFYVPRLLQVKEQCVEKLVPHLIFSVYNPVKINGSNYLCIVYTVPRMELDRKILLLIM